MRPPVWRARRVRRAWLLPLLAVVVLVGVAVASQRHTPAAGDVFVASGDLTLKAGDVVEHDAVAPNGKIVVPQGALVKNDVLAGNGSIEIGGTVGHNVRAVNGDVTLDSTAVVGNEVSVLNGQVHRGEGAQVKTITTPTPGSPPPSSSNDDGGLFGLFARLIVNLVLAVVFIAIGTLIVLAWPRRVGRAVSALESAPWPAVGVGLFTGVLAPPIAAVLTVILAITIIGILVAWVPGLILLVGWMYGVAVLGLWAGRRLADSGHVPQAQGSLLVTAAVGLAAVVGVPLVLGAVLPWLGWLLAYFAGFVGLGAVVLSRLGSPLSIPRITVHGPRVTAPLQPPPDRRVS